MRPGPFHLAAASPLVPDHETFWLAVLVIFGLGSIVALRWSRRAYNRLPAEVRERHQEALEELNEERRLALAGELNSMMVCPHCQTRGAVYTKAIAKKAGVSGAKATGALLTGGVSLLAVGLSRTEQQTEAYCRACQCTWHFG